MNYQEEAQRHAIVEERWTRDDEHTMRHGGYTGPPFDTRPPGLICSTLGCDNHRPFDGTVNYDSARVDGWRLVPYGSLCDFVDMDTDRTVKDYPRHWVCPGCAEEADDGL